MNRRRQLLLVVATVTVVTVLTIISLDTADSRYSVSSSSQTVNVSRDSPVLVAAVASSSSSSSPALLEALISDSSKPNTSSEIADCVTKFFDPNGGGFFWDRAAQSCTGEVKGWLAPLQQFEVAGDELACAFDSVLGAAGDSATRMWVRHGFRGGAEQLFEGDDPLDPMLNLQNAQQHSPHGRRRVAELRPGAAVVRKFFPGWRPQKHQQLVGGGVKIRNRAPVTIDVDADTDAANRTSSSPSPSPSSSSSWVTERYGNFMFHTSWLFRQWLAWQPRPRFFSTPAFSKKMSPAEQFLFETARFRSYHDTKRWAQRVYRLENLCLSPLGGLAGLAPKIGRYAGKDDTRNVFHRSDASAFKTFLETVTSLEEAPAFFDDRPVILVPVSPESRVNVGHVFHQFLGLLGILKLRPFGSAATHLHHDDHDHAGRDSTDDDAGDASPEERMASRPLVVFVVSHGKSPHADRAGINEDETVAAWGLFFRLLDAPWAAVHHFPLSSEAARTATLRRLFARTEHRFAAAGSRSPESLVCFRRGLAYQNCASCAESRRPDTESLETYSFGNFVELTPRRRDTLATFRSLLRKCIPVSAPVAAWVRSNTAVAVPRVFFAVRAASRRLKLLPLQIDELRETFEGAGLVSEILFRRLRHGSRASYINDVRTSDIFIGAHDAAFTQIAMMMRPNPVVVELTEQYYSCKFLKKSGCWFDVFADFVNASYWQIEIPVSAGLCGIRSMKNILREAICRWHVSSSSSSSSPLPEMCRGASSNYKHVKKMFLRMTGNDCVRIEERGSEIFPMVLAAVCVLMLVLTAALVWRQQRQEEQS